MDEEPAHLARFVRGELDAGLFPHREHVRMGFEMLRRHDFVTSAYHYSLALRAMTARAGKPGAFHQTITIAFLALIAERLEAGPVADFLVFEQANPDLMDPRVLARWYRPERLTMAAARRTFVLPDAAR
jgi:hypothetical protein